MPSAINPILANLKERAKSDGFFGQNDGFFAQ
jgi:hypothetical protein